MCIGMPMQIAEAGDGVVLAVHDGALVPVNVMLVGPVAAGDYVLVHIDNAVRRMSAEEAALVRDALAACAAADRGDAFEHLIADLSGREPPLPPHLQTQLEKDQAA